MKKASDFNVTVVIFKQNIEITLSKGIFYSSGQCGYKANQLNSLKTHNKCTQSITSLSTHNTSRGNKTKRHMRDLWFCGIQAYNLAEQIEAFEEENGRLVVLRNKLKKVRNHSKVDKESVSSYTKSSIDIS